MRRRILIAERESLHERMSVNAVTVLCDQIVITERIRK